jgi:putative endonuclease
MTNYHFVYTIQSEINPSKIYTGYTQDLKHRLGQHNTGSVGFTSNFKPWFIRSATAFKDKEQALEFERYLKTGSGRAFLKRHLWRCFHPLFWVRWEEASASGGAWLPKWPEMLSYSASYLSDIVYGIVPMPVELSETIRTLRRNYAIDYVSLGFYLCETDPDTGASFGLGKVLTELAAKQLEDHDRTWI